MCPVDADTPVLGRMILCPCGCFRHNSRFLRLNRGGRIEIDIHKHLFGRIEDFKTRAGTSDNTVKQVERSYFSCDALPRIDPVTVELFPDIGGSDAAFYCTHGKTAADVKTVL